MKLSSVPIGNYVRAYVPAQAEKMIFRIMDRTSLGTRIVRYDDKGVRMMVAGDWASDEDVVVMEVIGAAL